MNTITFSLILAGVLFQAAAQLLLKAGANALGTIGFLPGQLATMVVNAATQPFIIAGLTCNVCSVAFWIVALTRVDVSIAYPMLSIGYVVNAIAAWYLFGEALTGSRILGISVIIIGVVIISRG